MQRAHLAKPGVSATRMDESAMANGAAQGHVVGKAGHQVGPQGVAWARIAVE
jgi:hypothetical protein